MGALRAVPMAAVARGMALARAGTPTGVPRPTPAQSSSGPRSPANAPPALLGSGGGIVAGARGTKTLLGQ